MGYRIEITRAWSYTDAIVTTLGNNGGIPYAAQLPLVDERSDRKIVVSFSGVDV